MRGSAGGKKRFFPVQNRRICSCPVVGPRHSTGVQVNLRRFGERRVRIIIEVGVAEKSQAELSCVQLEQVPIGRRLCRDFRAANLCVELIGHIALFRTKDVSRAGQDFSVTQRTDMQVWNSSPFTYESA